ncbi:MAG: phosphoglucosamine mutase, partial [Rhodoglobus sp.]|nr:phosphoglucosamine mutase [Rhodoglobus sp.]
NHHALRSDEVIAQAVADAEARLGDTGRVLLRPSGTEPMVRVMVEAEHQDIADEIAHSLAAVVRERLTI